MNSTITASDARQYGRPPVDTGVARSITFAPRVSALALTTALISGCAGVPPLPTWNESEAKAAADSMPQALDHLEKVRSGYHKAVRDAFKTEHMAGNALLGAGALVTALAASNIHRDAILGTSFVAGTGYLYANRNVSRAGMMSYLAGIDALNCAERAAAPLSISQDELGELSGMIGQLRFELAVLRQKIDGVEVLLNTKQQSKGLSEWQAARTAADAAERSYTTATDTLKSGQSFASALRRAPRQLVSTVRGIDAAVTKSIVASTPDLSTIPALIGGLAGAVGSFAPGAGLEAMLGDTLKSVQKGLAAQAGATEDSKKLVDAAKEMTSQVDKVAKLQTKLSTLLAGRTDAWPADAFKDCGVVQVVAMLSSSDTALKFTEGVDGKRIVDIQGGVKPYFAEFSETLPGLSVRSPYRYDSRVEVLAEGAKLKAGTTQLRITDSSPQAKSLSVALTVAAGEVKKPSDKDAGEDEEANKDADKDSEASKTLAISALKALTKLSGDFAQFKVVESSFKASGSAWSMRVNCPSGASKKASELKTAVLAAAKLSKLPKGVTLKIDTEPTGCKVVG